MNKQYSRNTYNTNTSVSVNYFVAHQEVPHCMYKNYVASYEHPRKAQGPSETTLGDNPTSSVQHSIADTSTKVK